MASLDEMTKAGYKPVQQKSTIDQISSLLSGVQEGMAKKQEKEKADLMDQVKLYGELRGAGYSPADAHERVTRTYRSTDFIERLVGGQTSEMGAPTEEDKTSLDRRKAVAGIGKDKAETRKATAQAGYYERGGPSRKGYEGLTPNQIQTRIKSLQGQLGMGTEEDDGALNSEIGYLNDLFNTKSGFKQTGEAPPDAGGGAPGAAATTVVMRGPDGKQYKIPKQNVEKARARGFK